MYITEKWLSILGPVRIIGGTKCQSSLFHTLSWQKLCTFQALRLSLTILQNMNCWKRKVSLNMYLQFHVSDVLTLSLQGTHVFLTGGVFSNYQKMAKEAGTAWYRSKETVPIHDPFVGGGFLSNKKWPLIEECTLLTIITVWTLILRATTLNTEVSSPENSLYKVFRLCLSI